MPKIALDEDEDEGEQFEENEAESEEELEVPIRRLPKTNPNLKNIIRNHRNNPPQQERMQPQPPKRRYGVVPAQPLKIVDIEGQEVIAEGEYFIAHSLAEIIERLERIENTLGSMIQ